MTDKEYILNCYTSIGTIINECNNYPNKLSPDDGEYIRCLADRIAKYVEECYKEKIND